MIPMDQKITQSELTQRLSEVRDRLAREREGGRRALAVQRVDPGAGALHRVGGAHQVEVRDRANRASLAPTGPNNCARIPRVLAAFGGFTLGWYIGPFQGPSLQDRLRGTRWVPRNNSHD